MEDGVWTCAVCGEFHPHFPADMRREGAQCSQCGSTWRNRATVVALMLGFQWALEPIPDWREDWSRRGVGFDDCPAIFSRLPSRVSYTNTHLGRFPKLDLLCPPSEALGALDFALCAMVMEHVPPPVQRGFDGLAALLRPGGFAVVTVPIFESETTVEYYPGLVEFEILDGPVVRWRDDADEWHTDESPDMHEGTGLVLAFRRFSAAGAVLGLERAGFATVWEPPALPELGVFEIADPGVFLARMH
jgi:SAM-dependent methyltransferase